MKSRHVVSLLSGAVLAMGCAGRLVGPDSSRVPPGIFATLLDTLQRDHAVFVQPRYQFVLPAPADVQFNSRRTAAADSAMNRGSLRHIWIISNRRGEWAQIIEFDAAPLVAKGPINAEASLRRYAIAQDSSARVNPNWEVRGSTIKGDGDRTDYRQTVWDKANGVYLRQRCAPSPEGRVIPAFVCITAASADSMAFNPEVRGIQWADHVPGFRLPANLAEAAKSDTTAKRK